MIFSELYSRIMFMLKPILRISSKHLILQTRKLNSKERKSLAEVVDKSYLCPSLKVNLVLKPLIWRKNRFLQGNEQREKIGTHMAEKKWKIFLCVWWEESTGMFKRKFIRKLLRR